MLIIALESFHNKQIGLGNLTRAGLIDWHLVIKFFWTWLKDFSFLIIATVFSSAWDFDNRVAVGYNGKYQDLTSLRNYFISSAC